MRPVQKAKLDKTVIIPYVNWGRAKVTLSRAGQTRVSEAMLSCSPNSNIVASIEPNATGDSTSVRFVNLNYDAAHPKREILLPLGAIPWSPKIRGTWSHNDSFFALFSPLGHLALVNPQGALRPLCCPSSYHVLETRHDKVY